MKKLFILTFLFSLVLFPVFGVKAATTNTPCDTSQWEVAGAGYPDLSSQSDTTNPFTETYAFNDKVFEAVGSGKADDQVTAKCYAILNARISIATQASLPDLSATKNPTILAEKSYSTNSSAPYYEWIAISVPNITALKPPANSDTIYIVTESDADPIMLNTINSVSEIVAKDIHVHFTDGLMSVTAGSMTRSDKGVQGSQDFLWEGTFSTNTTGDVTFNQTKLEPASLSDLPFLTAINAPVGGFVSYFFSKKHISSIEIKKGWIVANIATPNGNGGGGNVGNGANQMPSFIAGLVPDCMRTIVVDPTTHLVNNPCDFNALMTLVNNVIQFLLFYLATPLAAIAFSYAGFLLITSGGSEEKLGTAKKIIKNVLIGYVIALAAWLIVNTILTTLGVSSSGIFLSK